ncbi:hypothetical protein DH2020_013771 [Rehmannia glutinosa]|uniref:Uncharacterized protein n=1 Tax=Rehmannia glutinosa TaxID=99300 RepID=A0ABR0X381_REHGL
MSLSCELHYHIIEPSLHDCLLVSGFKENVGMQIASGMLNPKKLGRELNTLGHATPDSSSRTSQSPANPHVRLYNADRGMLLARQHGNPKSLSPSPTTSYSALANQIRRRQLGFAENIVAHYPATNITTICVGSEVLTSLPNVAPVLINALKYIQSALVASNLDRQIKVSTPLASDRNGSLLNSTIPAMDSKSSGSSPAKFLYNNAFFAANALIGLLWIAVLL